MTEADLNHAMDVARWTCLAAMAKERLSTKRLTAQGWNAPLRPGAGHPQKTNRLLCAERAFP
jgi:hypothetical protein